MYIAKNHHPPFSMVNLRASKTLARNPSALILISLPSSFNAFTRTLLYLGTLRILVSSMKKEDIITLPNEHLRQIGQQVGTFVNIQ